jgi:hypothetical protein
MDPRDAVRMMRRLGAVEAVRVVPRIVFCQVTEVSADNTRVKLRRQEEATADARWYACLKTYTPVVDDVVLGLQQENVIWVLGNIW